MKIFLGLVHHPIKNKHGELVTTSVTNLDIHDIARTSKTFGFERYFVITPLEIQHDLIRRILNHWSEDKSLEYNPDRADALELVTLLPSIESTVQVITEQTGKRPLVVMTGAQFENGVTVKKLKERLVLDNKDLLILFGTGHGLHASAIESADVLLAPIHGASLTGYNHLSVRSAVAIYSYLLREASET